MHHPDMQSRRIPIPDTKSPLCIISQNSVQSTWLFEKINKAIYLYFFKHVIRMAKIKNSSLQQITFVIQIFYRANFVCKQYNIAISDFTVRLQ